GGRAGNSGGEDRRARIPGRTHAVDLLLQHGNDLALTSQRKEPVVGRKQQRNTVVREQRLGLALAPPACRKGIEIFTEPPADIAVVHGRTPSRCSGPQGTMQRVPSAVPVSSPRAPR